MIRTIDFNALPSGTIIDDDYADGFGVRISALGGAGRAMLFDSGNPTGDDTDLASATLGGLLIVSTDGDVTEPDDHDGGGSLFFDFDGAVQLKQLTFKDIEETDATGAGARMIFYDIEGEVIRNDFVTPTGDGGELTVGLDVVGVARLEVVLPGSGAVDNLVFDDGLPETLPPVAVDDASTTFEDTPVIIDLRSNDVDPDNILSDLIVGGIVSPDGQVVNNGDWTVVFTPAADFNGEARFTYGLTDPVGNADTGEVVINVVPVNDAPLAEADIFGTEYETTVDLLPLANDTDPDGDPLTILTASVSGAQGTVDINGDGSITFAPATGFSGSAEVTYTISDRPEGDPEGLSDTTTLSILVAGPGLRDGIVLGDDADNLIDLDFTGDPDGDLIDNADAILPGEAPQDDIVRAGAGDDTVAAGLGQDDVDGGEGNDLLFGEAGDDNLHGAEGDDTLDGGAGFDQVTGGAGADLFLNVNAGDDIDGGSGPVDDDTLDLRGSAPEGGRLSITYTSDDRENGFVSYFDADGAKIDEWLVFREIENVIPCFTTGTRIATPRGERRVEELEVGDLVITRDNGMQAIRWVGQRFLTKEELACAAHLRPVRLCKGALGYGLPERDMLVSPNHRLLIANDRTALYFEEREVLVAAKYLTDMAGVSVAEVADVTYVHIMFDRHEVVLSDGTWTESFQPGEMSLAGIGAAQRKEILTLFPELGRREGMRAYAAARRSLKRHEARLLTG